jgi:phosphate transport system substrate-binding protein
MKGEVGMRGDCRPHRLCLLSSIQNSARVFALILAVVFFIGQEGFPACAESETYDLCGAGASFPYPLYSKWATQYQEISGVRLSYQSVGSAAGIAQIKARAVDFGASEEPLDSIALAKERLVQFPMVMGGVVPVVNLKGVKRGQLRLTPELLADIYLGKIKMWNDRRILAVNQDLRLPDQEITVAHSADGSGTTWIFTSYLTKVSNAWKEKVGTAKSVSWPTGVGGKGNEGVSALVRKTEGSIGYVEFAYAIRERLKYVELQNRAGKFVTPTVQTFQAAAANADWKNAPGFYISLTDQPGDRSWPITGATYILVHKDQPDPGKATAMLKFFDWCLKSGSDMAISLDYVPIPAEVSNLVRSTWKDEIASGGKPVWQ